MDLQTIEKHLIEIREKQAIDSTNIQNICRKVEKYEKGLNEKVSWKGFVFLVSAVIAIIGAVWNYTQKIDEHLRYHCVDAEVHCLQHHEDVEK